MTLSNEFKSGILIHVKICAWTGKQQLTPEDLGIPKDKIPSSFELGKKPMVPPSIIGALKHQDYLARKLLEGLSLPYIFGSARFLPKTNVIEFFDKYKVIEDCYARLVEDLVTNFQNYKFAVRADFVEAAKTAHERLSMQASYTTPLDEYINSFIERIEKKYPRVEDIREKYDMSYTMIQAELPDLAEASIDDVSEEAQKVRLIQEAYKKKHMKQLEKHAEDTVKYIRDIAKDVIDDLISSLSQGKKWTEKTMDKIEDAITRFTKVNVIKDVILEEALVSFKKKYLGGYSSEQIRNSDDIRKDMLKDLTVLSEIVTNVEQINALTEAYKKIVVN